MTDYEKDYYAWTQEQSSLIRSLNTSDRHPSLHGLDTVGIAEEIEDIGRHLKQRCSIQFMCLIMHLIELKISGCIDLESQINSLVWNIKLNRREVRYFIQESPSLEKYLEESLEELYRKATQMASCHRTIMEDLPRQSPFSFQEIMADNFFGE